MSAARSSRPASTFKVANVRTGRLDSPLAVIPFFVSYLLPVVFLRSTNLATDSRGSESALCNSWTCAWFVFTVLPVLEMVVPDDLANPTDEESRRAAKDWRYKLPLYLWALPQCAVIVFGARAFRDPFASLHRRVGLVLSAGVCTGGVGITVAHELLHKDKKLELFLAKFLLSSVCYAHFGVEHRFGHHRRVGTPEDPATAERGGSFYAFWVRSVYGTYRGAWRIWRGENDHDLGVAAKRTFGSAFMRDAHLFPALWSVALFFANARDARAVFFFLAQALVAATLLELVNYVEHYGLRRERVECASTREAYEKVTPAHSWNAPQRVTNWFIFRLQRHSDHHARAATPYQALRTYTEAPTLPTQRGRCSACHRGSRRPGAGVTRDWRSEGDDEDGGRKHESGSTPAHRPATRARRRPRPRRRWYGGVGARDALTWCILGARARRRCSSLRNENAMGDPNLSALRLTRARRRGAARDATGAAAGPAV